MLTCSICGFKSVSSTEYVSHCRTHRHLNNVRMSCALRDCGRRFSSFNSLAVHMSRTHPERSVRQTWNRSVSVPLKCSFNYCTREYVELKQLVSHLNDHIQEGLHVVCPFDGCGRTFNVKTSLSSHISRIHRGWNTTQISSIYLSDVQARLTDSTPEVSTYVSTDPDTDVHSQVCQGNTDNDKNAQDRFIENLALFCLGLQTKYLVPASTISEIVNEMKTLQDVQQEFTMGVLGLKLEQYGVQRETLLSLGQSVYEQSPLHAALCASGPLTTHHRRLQYFKSHFNYVHPVEVTLGYNDSGKRRHYHYVPLLDSLRAMLKKLMHSGDLAEHGRPIHVFRDFTDGHVVRSNEMFATDPDSLKVMLFQDAFEVANPLGSAKQKHKILAVYFTLGNLHPHLRSTVDQIQLVLLCSEKD